jgi:two-component system copper resistance phosphate regulon response regulator CusR
MRVLIVEDEPVIAEAIKEGLEEEHFQVDIAPDGRTGLRLAEERPYAAIILDLMLPGVDGWTICQRLREQGIDTPILMLTARGAPDERVRGLETGADDYLPKPFHFPELLARVRALMRRDRQYRGKVIRIDDLVIDTQGRRVTRAGKPVSLTQREYTLLEALAAREGHVLTRETIQERVWMDDASLASYSNTVDVHIGQLRKKIDGGHPVKLIHTIRGLGYVLRRPEEA